MCEICPVWNLRCCECAEREWEADNALKSLGEGFRRCADGSEIILLSCLSCTVLCLYSFVGEVNALEKEGNQSLLSWRNFGRISNHMTYS